MDQISEHQRDLTNSASSRFVADYLAGFAAALNRMSTVVSSLEVDRERMLANLRSTGGFVAAEPLYILLSLAGEADAHEVVRRLTLEAEKTERPLAEVFRASEAYSRLHDLGASAAGGGGRAGWSAEDLLASPESYAGLAAAKATRLARLYRKKMAGLSKRLAGEK
jgi:adenylosuccinate lyase